MSCKCKNSKNNEKTAKHITVYLNGLRTAKHTFTLDPKRKPKWYHILNEITSKINPYFGIVKKLYSSESGVTICSFSDIENNGTYVASDSRQFQILKGGYRTEGKKRNFEHYLTGQLDRNNRIKKLSHVRCDLIVIYVFNNGKDRDPPEKIVLSKEDLQNWEQTLSFIALILDMPYRTIKALYNSNGHKICGPWELQHGASYIAVGYHEKFISRNYKIRESVTEIWKDYNPIVNKNKNERCFHKHTPKSWKQNLEWKHSAENFYDYSPLQNNNNPKPTKSWNNGENWKQGENRKRAKNCFCHASSSSESSGVNTSAVFHMPSYKYGYLQDQNSKLKKPLYNSYEKKNYSSTQNNNASEKKSGFVLKKCSCNPNKL